MVLDDNVITENLLHVDLVHYDIEGSEISKFFAGKYVFLTGGTGFLGKLTIEKLLRACPDLQGIFMLVRAKKGKDIHTRLEEIFSEALYGKLSKLQPKFRHKITPINGDVSLPGLGISQDDRNLLTEKASVIYSIAATVKFDEKLSISVAINVKGAKEMLILAKECRHLEAFVHVSTAFTNCQKRHIEEKFYEIPINPDNLIQVCESTPPKTLEKITPDLVGDWPNTYAFTKAIAEHVVLKYASQLPLCIFRPSIVIGTYKEPIRSWIDNVYGPTGVILGAGLGILRALNCDSSKVAELVPADMVINAMIATSYKTAIDKPKDVPIYNFVSGPHNPITWEEFRTFNKFYGLKTPTIRSMWYYSLIFFKNKYQYYLYIFFVHFIPAFLIDGFLILTRRKPQLTNVYKKIHKFSSVISYFSTQSWTFTDENTQSLWRSLSDADQKLFAFDISKLDWDEFYQTYPMGLRTYLLKDGPETIPEARKKWRRLFYLHSLIQVVAVVICLRFLYWILGILWRFI